MSTISSGTTLTTALVQTGDTTGDLVIKTNNGNTTAVTINTAGAIGVGSSPSYGSSGQFLQSAGNAAPATWATVPATTPGGSTTQVQYNNAGAFGGDSGFVYTGGNVGIGTSSPSGRLHVNSSGAAITYIQSTLVAGNTNVETRYISTNRTWGVGQNIIQTSSVFEIADVTANLTRLAIDSSGNVGIGTSSPSRKLHVVDSGSFVATFQSSGTGIYTSWQASGGTVGYIGGAAGLGAGSATDFGIRSETNMVFMTNAGTERMRISSTGGLSVGTTADPGAGAIYATGNITAYYSDDRLKTKLGGIENALDKVKSLSGFYYEANQTAQDLGYQAVREVGVSAQQVQAVMPEVVKPAPIDQQYLTVDYERLVPLLIEAIKELEEKVAKLEAK